MQQYVLGFMFNPSRSKVVLIKKNKPAYMAGLLNGVGGKIEEGETPMEAMQREFQEEAGVFSAWDYKGQFGNFLAGGFSVHVFCCYSDLYAEARTIEEEEIVKVHIKNLQNYDIMSNLSWLIPLCLDKELNQFRITIDETK